MNIVLQKFLSPLALHVFSHMELKNEYIYICIYIGYTYSIPWVWNNYSIREPSRRTDHHRFFVVFFQPVSILFPQSINFRNVVVKKTSVLLVEIVGPHPPSVPFHSSSAGSVAAALAASCTADNHLWLPCRHPSLVAAMACRRCTLGLGVVR
jgi:hypothetical protein